MSIEFFNTLSLLGLAPACAYAGYLYGVAMERRRGAKPILESDG